MTKTLTTSPASSGPLTVAVRATDLDLQVIADGSVKNPVAELSGPEKLLDQVRADRSGNTWTLTWPKSAGGGGRSTIVVGNGTVMTSSFGRNNRVTVNGVDITNLINEQQGADGGPLRAVIRVPAGSALDAELSSGAIETRGRFAAVSTQTQSADLFCDGPFGQLQASSQSGDVTAEDTGPVSASTMSGDVNLNGARGTVTASAMSGDVRVHALESVMVNASTMSGDVRVTAAPGARPQVSGRSMSGRVRTP